MTLAFVCGCAGTVLSPDERAFIRQTQPWGLILFKRNVEDRAQMRALTASFREYLGVTMPGERRVTWIAESAPGAAAGHHPDGEAILGSSNVLLFDDMAVLEVLVHPKARHSGVGQALLAAAVRRTYEEGFDSIREDSKTLINQLQDGKISVTEGPGDADARAPAPPPP